MNPAAARETPGPAKPNGSAPGCGPCHEGWLVNICVVALGKIGFDTYLRYLKRAGVISTAAPYPFAHAAEYKMPDGRYLVASFHPSMQNTNTGRLTAKMFAQIFKRARKLAKL